LLNKVENNSPIETPASQWAKEALSFYKAQKNTAKNRQINRFRFKTA
jgi:hypothetical protein